MGDLCSCDTSFDFHASFGQTHSHLDRVRQEYIHGDPSYLGTSAKTNVFNPFPAHLRDSNNISLSDPSTPVFLGQNRQHMHHIAAATQIPKVFGGYVSAFSLNISPVP